MDQTRGTEQLTMTFSDEGTHLLARAEGAWVEAAIKQKIVLMKEEAERTGHTRILLDMRRVSAPDIQASRYFVGVHAAEIWKPPLRVAGVLDPEVLDGLTETTAVNRGADVKAFIDLDVARDWLLSD